MSEPNMIRLQFQKEIKKLYKFYQVGCPMEEVVKKRFIFLF